MPLYGKYYALDVKVSDGAKNCPIGLKIILRE